MEGYYTSGLTFFSVSVLFVFKYIKTLKERFLGILFDGVWIFTSGYNYSSSISRSKRVTILKIRVPYLLW